MPIQLRQADLQTIARPWCLLKVPIVYVVVRAPKPDLTLIWYHVLRFLNNSSSSYLNMPM